MILEKHQLIVGLEHFIFLNFLNGVIPFKMKYNLRVNTFMLQPLPHFRQPVAEAVGNQDTSTKV